MAIRNDVIYKNLSAILTMLTKLDDRKFAGQIFTRSDANSDGCAMHHAYHKKNMPVVLRNYMDNQETHDSSFLRDDELRKEIEFHYGAGAANLFGNMAATCYGDKGRFIALLKEHMKGFTPKDETVQKILLECNGKQVEYPTEADAQAQVKELQKFGLTGISILKTSTTRLTF